MEHGTPVQTSRLSQLTQEMGKRKINLIKYDGMVTCQNFLRKKEYELFIFLRMTFHTPRTRTQIHYIVCMYLHMYYLLTL